MDNGQASAPVIPAGTQPTVFGTKSFAGTPNQGQAVQSAQVGKSEPASQAVAQQPTAANAPTGTTFDELAAKKGFKSADDLAAAYANLESQNKKVEMSLAELAKARESQQPAVQPAAQPSYAAQTQEEAIRVVEAIARKAVQPLEDKMALQELFLKNQDAQQYAVEMAKLVKENPGISWNVAYRAAKTDALESNLKAERESKANELQDLRQRTSVGSVKATAAAPTRSLDDLVGDKSIPFAEVQRIMREKFSA